MLAARPMRPQVWFKTWYADRRILVRQAGPASLNPSALKLTKHAFIRPEAGTACPVSTLTYGKA
jgi:hypothetical protein